MAAQIQGLDTEYKPWGGLAGIMTGVREADTEAANLLALQESQLGNVVKARDAAFAQDEMGNQELRNSRMQGMIGDSQVKTAAGRTAMGTQESDMQAKIAENLAKVPKAQVEQALATTHQQNLGLMGLASALEQGGGSDLNFVSKAMSMAPQLGMKPQDLQQLLSNPDLLKKKIAQNQYMLTMIPEHMRKLNELEKGEQFKMPAHAMAAAAQIEAAQIHADAAKAAAKIHADSSKSNQEKSRTFEQAATAAFDDAAKEADPVKRELHNKNAQMYLEQAVKLRTVAPELKASAEERQLDRMLNRNKPGSGGKPMGDGTASNPIKLGG